MRVAVLNGNPDAENAGLDQYLKEVSGLLESAGH
jgi:hypothetical protein